MAGKINFLGHPVHPMLIVFPLGLLPAAVACDIIYLVRGGGQWAHIAYWLIAAGVVSGLVAAVFGFTDWLALDNGTRAKRIGLLARFCHGHRHNSFCRKLVVATKQSRCANNP